MNWRETRTELIISVLETFLTYLLEYEENYYYNDVESLLLYVK